jgi:tetratricopeptide (TPR) repeat protein
VSIGYSNLGKESLAAENTRKAYELRQRVSEREKFYIESHYHDHVTGDLEKARQVFELWELTYPRDSVPRVSLGIIYEQLGQYDQALVENLKSMRLSPSALNYARLEFSYLYLGRLQETQATADEALAKKLDSPALRDSLYQLAFLQNDEAGMAKQVAWAAGKPGVEDYFLGHEANKAAYVGRLGKAREFSRRAMALAESAGKKEVAARYKINAVLREGLFGNAAEARKQVASALEFSTGQYVQCRAAWALALAGDSGRAQALAVDLGKRYPENTIVQFKCLPILQAQIALNRNDTTKAFEALQAAAATELGIGDLYPAFLRGEAYLAARQGDQAAVEFKKILDRPGVVISEPIGALAHVGLARAYVIAGDQAKAKAAYQDFLTLWRDADPDIPVLIAAKSEYTKLH